MLLDRYEDYLKKSIHRGKPLNARSIEMYKNCLKRFLNHGYSEEDLLGAVEQLIVEYSKGGGFYNPKDHNVLTALKHLKRYKHLPYAQRLCISYHLGYPSWVRKDKYVYEFTIANGKAEVSYYQERISLGNQTISLNKKQYELLVDMMLRYRRVLSPSDTAIVGFHGIQCAYAYELDDLTYGNRCNQLFESDMSPVVADKGCVEFQQWLKKNIPHW